MDALAALQRDAIMRADDTVTMARFGLGTGIAAGEA